MLKLVCKLPTREYSYEYLQSFIVLTQRVSHDDETHEVDWPCL